jgi:zinc protease
MRSDIGGIWGKLSTCAPIGNRRKLARVNNPRAGCHPAPLVACVVMMVASTLSAQTVDRTKEPQTPPLPAYHLPAVFETKLSNGLSVVLLEDGRFPLITVRLAFAAGSRFDPPELRGLSEAVGSLLNEGTKKRSSRQIAEEATAIGGSIGAQSTPDSLIIAGSSLAEHSTKLLEMVADVARNSTFPADEVALYKENRKQHLLEQRSQPEYLAQEKLDEAVFGANPYGHTNPSPESVDKLDIPALAQFRDGYLAPNNAVLIVLGKLPARAALLKQLQQQFGDWPQRPVPATQMAPLPAPRRSLTLVDRPGSVQANVQIGRLGVTRTNPDYYAMVVGNAILGGGTSSRLFNDIREKQGFAYSVYSHQTPLKDAGLFGAAMQVRNEVVEPALAAMLGHLSAMAKEPVTAAELSNVKNYLSGVFVLRLQTQDGLASQLAAVKTMGLPVDYLEKYTTRIRSIEPDQIQAAARKYIAPDDAAIVVVGDAAKIGPALEKVGKFELVREK